MGLSLDGFGGEFEIGKKGNKRIFLFGNKFRS